MNGMLGMEPTASPVDVVGAFRKNEDVVARFQSEKALSSVIFEKAPAAVKPSTIESLRQEDESKEVALFPSAGRISRRHRGKKGKSVKKRRPAVEYTVMVKRAIFRTQSDGGTTVERIIKHIVKRYEVNDKKCKDSVVRVIKMMLRNGYIYRNRKNPLKLKVTLKGRYLRSMMKKKGKRGRRGRRRRR